MLVSRLRRDLIVGIAGLGLSLAGHAAEVSDGIDSHIHLYRAEDTGWGPKNGALFAPHLAEDFAVRIAGSSIGRAILIEAGTSSAHNLWMLEHARDEPMIVAVIANLDPNSPDAAAELRRLAKNPKFRGIRGRGHDPVNFDSPEAGATFETMEELGLVLEVNLTAETVDVVAEIAAKFPKMTIVIDHLAGGRVDSEGKAEEWWLSAIQRLAEFSSTRLKLSAFDFAFRGDYHPERLEVLFGPALAGFGSDRLLYGSNWPVSPDNRKMFEVLVKMIGDGQPDLLRKVLVENPTATYRLPVRVASDDEE